MRLDTTQHTHTHTNMNTFVVVTITVYETHTVMATKGQSYRYIHVINSFFISMLPRWPAVAAH